MPQGLHRIQKGWGGKQDSVVVRYEDGHYETVPVSFYRDLGYSPKVDKLPYKETERKGLKPEEKKHTG